MDFLNEKDLISRASHDPVAFAVIYEKYYPAIFQYALKRVGSVKTAEDVTSNTFFNALKNLWRFRWQNIAFSAWLYRIATNEINLLFRQGKHKSISLEFLGECGFDPPALSDVESELDDAEAQLSRHEEFLEAQRLLARLPTKYQEVIALRFFEDKKISEIAKILGKKEGTVKSLLSRGLEKLRENWSDPSQQNEMQPFPFTRILESRGK